jgi:hypothetical protein
MLGCVDLPRGLDVCGLNSNPAELKADVAGCAISPEVGAGSAETVGADIAAIFELVAFRSTKCIPPYTHASFTLTYHAYMVPLPTYARRTGGGRCP